DDDAFDDIKVRLDKFKSAYASLRILLTFERRTGLTKYLSSAYKYLHEGDGMNDSYYSALNQYLYESKHFDERLLESLVEEFQKETNKHDLIEINEDTWMDIKVIWHLVFSSLNGDVFSELDLIELAINLKNAQNSFALKPYLALTEIIHRICIDDLT
ncbi:TPA: hypothetical protein ACSI7N_005803, partial [Klebsiella pneumoniae]